MGKRLFMLIGRHQGRSLEFNVIEFNVIGFSLAIVDSCTMSKLPPLCKLNIS